MRGELSIAQGGPGALSAAEVSLQRSVDVAREIGARSWELRSTTSLARLKAKSGAIAEGCALLAPICKRLPGDVETRDRRAARTLLGELSARGTR